MKNQNHFNITTPYHEMVSDDFDSRKIETTNVFDTRENKLANSAENTDSVSEYIAAPGDILRQVAHTTMLNARQTSRERRARREVNRAAEESEPNFNLRRHASSQAQRFGRSLALFVRRAAHALRQGGRSAAESWHSTAPQPTVATELQQVNVRNNTSIDAKKRAMLLDAAEQHRATKHAESSVDHKVQFRSEPWGGGLVMGEDGATYYKPIDHPPQETTTAASIPEYTSHTNTIEKSDTPDKDDELTAANRAFNAWVAKNAQQAKARQERAALAASERDRRASHATQVPDKPSVNSVRPEKEVLQATAAPKTQERTDAPSISIGEFVSSSTNPDNMEEVLASFDPNHNYSYLEAMEMIPDKKGFRNYWENSILDKYDINTMPALGEIARALIVKDIHESMAKTRQAIEDGRLPEGGKIRGTVGNIIGHSGIGSEYLRSQAALRGLVSRDKNSFEADGMSFSELAKLIDIDTSTIEGYDKIYA